MSHKLYEGDAHTPLLRRLVTLALFAGTGFRDRAMWSSCATRRRLGAGSSPGRPDGSRGSKQTSRSFWRTSWGALNSTLAVGFISLDDNQLEDGESVNVQFLLGVEKTGTFRFYINIEGFDDCGCQASPAAASSPASDSSPGWLMTLKKKLRTSVQSAPRPKARSGHK
jgi:hypothetical protein